jgi:hypothetical protein
MIPASGNVQGRVLSVIPARIFPYIIGLWKRPS